MTEPTTESKPEIAYSRPTKNPYFDRGNQNIGWLEYRMPSQAFAVFLPIVKPDLSDAEKVWGSNCSAQWLVNKMTRGIGNDWDNKVPAMVKAYRKEGKTDQEIADALQAYVLEYEVNAPRSSASAETKRKAAVVSEAEAAGITEEEIRAQVAKMIAAKGKKK